MAVKSAEFCLCSITFSSILLSVTQQNVSNYTRKGLCVKSLDITGVSQNANGAARTAENYNRVESNRVGTHQK